MKKFWSVLLVCLLFFSTLPPFIACAEGSAGYMTSASEQVTEAMFDFENYNGSTGSTTATIQDASGNNWTFVTRQRKSGDQKLTIVTQADGAAFKPLDDQYVVIGAGEETGEYQRFGISPAVTDMGAGEALRVSFDIKNDSFSSVKQAVFAKTQNVGSSGSNPKNYILQMNTDGTISFGGIGTDIYYVLDQWYHFDFVFTWAVAGGNDKMDCYMDGALIASTEQDFSTWNFTFFGFLLNTAEKEAGNTMCVDNLALKIYDAMGDPTLDIPTQESTGITNVFANIDFENEDVLDGFSITPNQNTVSREADASADNHYLSINKTTNTTCMVQLPITNERNQHVVIEADFSTQNGVPGGRLFIGRDATASNMINYYLYVDSSGNITLPNGTILGKISVGKWTRVAVAIDFGTKTYDIYVNNILVKQAQPLANQTTNTIQHLRIQLNSLLGDLMVDNLRAYESTKPGEISSTPVKRSILLSKTAVMNVLGNVKVVESYTGKMYVNKEKQSTAQPVIRENGQVYLSLQDMQALFGGSARFTNESTTHPGYYPLCSNATALEFETENYFDNGLTVISDSTIHFTTDWQNEIFKFMIFDRPTADEFKTLYNQHVAGQHPRVILTPERVTSIKALCETDANMIQWKANVLAAASEALNTPVAGYTMSSTGSLRDVDTALPLMMNLGMAYQLTGSVDYANRAWLELQKIFSLTDWNLASYLDVGELTAITSIAYDWMYAAFSAEQRRYIEENIFNFGVNNTYKLYYNELEGAYTTWYDSVGNWNAVCNGGSMLGAIALFDRYPEECSSLLENASQALQFMMLSYYPDGAWAEGTGYWNYALQYMALTVESFLQAFGTDFGYLSFPGFSNTGWYGLVLSGSTGVNAFGDGSSAFIDSHSVMWCANRFQNADLMNARLMEMEKNNWDGGVYELLYYTPDLVGENYQLDLDTGMRGIEAVSLREAWYEPNATFLSFHGGAAKRNHGHLDIGSYVLDMAGERFVMDPGAESYNASGYFGTQRYLYYRARPEGHNMYVINPTAAVDDYGINIDATAAYDSIRSATQGAYSIMDLTEAYNRDVTSAKRGYMLADGRCSAIVRDEITLKGESEVYWFVHTKADVEIVDNQTAYLTLNGKRVKMMVLTNAASYTLEEMNAAPLPTSPTISQTDNTAVGLRKLAIHANAGGQLNITVKFIPADDVAADNRPTDTFLADWHVSDDEAIVLPTADMVCAERADWYGERSGLSSNLY